MSWKYPDGTVRQSPPDFIITGELRVPWRVATPEQRKAAGYYEYSIEQPPERYVATTWEEVNDENGVIVKRPKTLSPKPLDELRKNKRAEIQAEKKRIRDGGFIVSVNGEDTLFDSDSEARLAYLQLANKLAQDNSYTTQWKASEGVWVTMDATLFADIQDAAEIHLQNVFTWQAMRNAEIAAANSPEEIFAVSCEYTKP